MSINISLGFSPCPNDTFIFDALVNKKIDTGNIDFNFHIADVAELNDMAFNQQLAVTKLSFHAMGYVLPNYQLLNAGSALGNNCGPLLIAKRAIKHQDISQARIAIPGKYTTANFLLGLAFPDAHNKQIYLFSDIENAVLNNEVDIGLIIHENRFTYQDKGLIKLIDLGEFWEQNMKQPIPLGGIAIKRDLPNEIKQQVDRLIHDSVALAFQQPEQTHAYVKQYAQEMELSVMMQHIGLYVNDFTLNLGQQGKAAVNSLYQHAWQKQLIPEFKGPIFI